MDDGQKKICKITDFGLSRKIGTSGVYVKTTVVSSTCNSLEKCNSGVYGIALSIIKRQQC